MITLKKIKVKDIYRLDDDNPIFLKLPDDFSQVVINFANHAELRGIFVVDDDDRFLGVITRTDMLDWARVKLGGFKLKPLTDMDKTLRLITLIRATSVGEILRSETKQAAVKTEDTLERALRVMVKTDLIVLPVVDEEQCVIGRLRLAELLNQTLS